MYIADVLASDLIRPTRRSHATPVLIQVLLALKFFATGTFLITAGDFLHLHESTASRCVRRVALALAKQAPHFIRWPTAAEVPELQRQFYAVDGFPGVVGAIDGTHVRIQGPPLHEEVFVNRHFYHSINVQLVVDARSRILNVVAKWPGSVHDSYVLSQSSVGENFATGAYGGLLIGDSGYPCRPWLMAPFRSPTTPAECAYNQTHATTRSVVERTIGQLKRRFHCLHAELRMLPERCCTIAVACCVMHNIAQHYTCREGDCDLPPEVPVPPSPPEADDGVARRHAIVHQHFRARVPAAEPAGGVLGLQAGRGRGGPGRRRPGGTGRPSAAAAAASGSGGPSAIGRGLSRRGRGLSRRGRATSPKAGSLVPSNSGTSRKMTPESTSTLWLKAQLLAQPHQLLAAHWLGLC
ncbi:putative nuclease HARBI1 [Ixodes scapularis]|uniref:putative nuclease HARBI1 n=1 Tax=Ixodes scapularis TaxID=6945 RepID=UPI001C3814C1|nr:putative nuclease HARBI1 [Ixodes scapularis]